MFFQKRIVEASKIANLMNVQRMQALFSDFSHSRNIAHVERRKKLRFLPGNNPENPVRLGFGGRDFGNQARNADPDRTIKLCLGFHSLVQAMGGAQRRAVQAGGAGHVEISFVNGSHLDQRRETTVSTR